MTISVKCPQTNFNTIKSILIALKSNGPLKIENIANLIGKNRSAVSNATPIMQEMGLIYLTRENGFDLTERGKPFVENLIIDDKVKIKEFSNDVVLNNSEILREALKIIQSTPNISPQQLGHSLNEAIKAKKWASEITYAHVGRTCISILEGLSLYEDTGLVRRHQYRTDRGTLENKLLPGVYAKNIFEIVDKADVNNNIALIDKNATTSENYKNIQFANNLIDLDIAYYVDYKNHILQLTNDGIELKNNNDPKKRKIIFQNILLKNKSIDSILRVINTKYKNIGYMDIGNILEQYNKVKWKPKTKRSYSVKLMTWLKDSNILESNSEWGKYHLTPSIIDRYKGLLEIVTDTLTMKIDAVDIEKIIGELHRNCNRILHSEKKEWYNDIGLKEKILTGIDSLIDFYRLNNQSIRTLIHMKHFIEAGYELKRIKYIENCVQLLVDDIE